MSDVVVPVIKIFAITASRISQKHQSYHDRQAGRPRLTRVVMAIAIDEPVSGVRQNVVMLAGGGRRRRGIAARLRVVGGLSSIRDIQPEMCKRAKNIEWRRRQRQKQCRACLHRRSRLFLSALSIRPAWPVLSSWLRRTRMYPRAPG